MYTTLTQQGLCPAHSFHLPRLCSSLLGVRLSYLPIHVGPAPSGCLCVVHSAPIHFIPSLFLHILLQQCLRFPPGSESVSKRSMQQLFTPWSARKHRAQARTRVGKKYSKAPVMCSHQPGPACFIKDL